VPGLGALRLAHRCEEHRAAARDARLEPRPPQGARRGDARPRRAAQLRRPPSVAALRGDAAARLDRARALVRAGAPAHGRAVRRARRDDARAPQPRAALHLGEARLDGRVRDPLHLGGRLPLDARRRHEPAPRPHRGRRGHRPAIPAHSRDARGPALLRARHAGARAAAQARRAPPAGGGGRAPVKQVREWLPALVVFAIVIAAWEGSIAAFHIQQFLLPRPSAIVRSFWTERHSLWPAGWTTFKEALGGFFIGSGLGIAVATVVGRFRGVGTALMPIAIAANAGAWFGEVSPHSKMAIAAVLCFLPVMVNTLRGLSSANPRQIELMRS